LPKFNRSPEPRGQLVGRRAELTQIDRLLDEAQPSYPRVLQIAGESGVGKTRLLSHVAERASAAGYLVVIGRAAEFDTDEPFGVFLDALDQTFTERAEDALMGLEDEQLRELAGVFPTLAARLAQHAEEPPPPSGAGMDRYRLHRAVSALLDARASGRPVLLAVDDLHWADPASAELLLYLLRRPPSAPLFVAVAFRSRQLQPSTAAVLQQVQRDSAGKLIELSPLSAEEASPLLPPELSSAVAERIYRDSGGNPFYLEELIRAAQSDSDATIASLSADPERVPATVTAVIASEFDRLTPQGRKLIQAASVLGDQFEPDLAREIVEMDEAKTVAALDELVDRDLVQVAPAAGLFRFRHPIVRRAVYESAKGGWRRAAHARAAAVLAARGASATARARHVERSASLGDSEAIAVLTEAGYAAAARAPAAAAGWFSAALRLLPDQQDPGQRLELALAAAVSLGSAGRLQDSRDAFQEVLSLLPPDPEFRGPAVAAAALVEHLLGKHDDAQGLLLSALSGLDDNASGAAELKLGIALGCFFSADWSGMRYWAQKASQQCEDSPMVEAGAGGALALAEYGLGNVDTARDSAARAAVVADRLSDSDWAPQLISICFLGWAEYCVGRFDQAERHMSRALEVSKSTGQEHLSAAMLVVQAMSNLAQGRLVLASEQAETAIDTSLLSANHLFLTWALTVRCMVEIDRGSPTSAVRFGHKALEAGLQSRSPWSSVATLYLAEAWLEAGEPERFRKELFAGQSLPRLPPFLFYAVHAYELLTRAELELGLPDAAARWADQAVEVAEQLGLDGPRAEAQRAQAMLMLSRHSFATAAHLAQASADQAERAAQPIQAARSRLLAGTALGKAGNADAAVEQLRRAEETFAAHGAARYRDQAARELRALGVHVVATRGPAPSQTGLGALSKRELTIAQLVHAGRTNRQIAEELSISLKTVENHLAKIFRRLEISSRSQLATLVERSRGLAA
jgi:ATP/maltotriose-dependent transcriptional regulator MalT